MTDDEDKSGVAFLARELIVYQQRVARAQSDVRIAILVASKSLTESFELLRRVDGLLRQQLRERSAEQPMESNQSKTV
jgi:hypothetical protein